MVEPTGPAWLPVAVFFGRRGHTVLRVTSAKAADLRRFLARHAKSNRIDAETLARLPLVAPHWADRGRVRQPRSWESACITVEEVAEAAAVPVLDELRGRAVEMYVALKPGYTPSKEIEQKVTKALECSAPSVRRLPSTTPETRGRRESA